jgi:hypothetical protein
VKIQPQWVVTPGKQTTNTEEKGVAYFKVLFKQSPEESKNNLKILS